MNPIDHLGNLREHVERAGLAGLHEFAGKLYARAFREREGTNVYEADWDVLVVLDACRADLFWEVADDSPVPVDCETTTSVASMTRTWMERTFHGEYAREMAETVYVCGNPYSGVVLDGGAFAELDEVWRDGWDDGLGTVPPAPITDRAIDHWQEGPPDRLLCHYMQPHLPFVADGRGGDLRLDEFGERHIDDTWVRLQRGELDRKVVWGRYRNNLRYVLADVARLVEHVDDAATVVLTADHGNAMGELGVYGHPENVPIASLREVPWCVASPGDLSADRRAGE